MSNNIIININDLICPLLKGPCVREKCVCFSTRDYDIIGAPCKPYGACEFLKINLDYEREERKNEKEET